MRLHFRDSIARSIDAIFIDGKRARFVQEFDTDEGWVETLITDADGWPRPNDAGDGVAQHRLHGTVTYTTRAVNGAAA